MSSSLCGAVTHMSLASRTQHTPASSAPFSSRFSSALRGQTVLSNWPCCLKLFLLACQVRVRCICCCAGCSPRCVTARATFQVVAKQNSLKRERTSEKARQYNKAHKSAIATRMKKVHLVADMLNLCVTTLHKHLLPSEEPPKARILESMVLLPTRPHRRAAVPLADLLQMCTGVFSCRWLHDRIAFI